MIVYKFSDVADLVLFLIIFCYLPLVIYKFTISTTFEDIKDKVYIFAMFRKT